MWRLIGWTWGWCLCCVCVFNLTTPLLDGLLNFLTENFSALCLRLMTRPLSPLTPLSLARSRARARALSLLHTHTHSLSAVGPSIDIGLTIGRVRRCRSLRSIMEHAQILLPSSFPPPSLLLLPTDIQSLFGVDNKPPPVDYRLFLSFM